MLNCNVMCIKLPSKSLSKNKVSKWERVNDVESKYVNNSVF